MNCANCGYAREIHQFGTLNCPDGGEAPAGRVQGWLETIYKEPRDERRIAAALKHCEGFSTEVLEIGPTMSELVADYGREFEKPVAPPRVEQGARERDLETVKAAIEVLHSGGKAWAAPGSAYNTWRSDALAALARLACPQADAEQVESLRHIISQQNEERARIVNEMHAAADALQARAIQAEADAEALRAEKDAAIDAYNRRTVEAGALREALGNTTRMLEDMNTSPAHAASWVEPRSDAVTGRIKLNRHLLDARDATLSPDTAQADGRIKATDLRAATDSIPAVLGREYEIEMRKAEDAAQREEGK